MEYRHLHSTVIYIYLIYSIKQNDLATSSLFLFLFGGLIVAIFFVVSIGSSCGF